MRILFLVAWLAPMVSSHAQPTDGSAADSVLLRAGQPLAGEIRSFDGKAVYLADGRIVMYRVIAEIRTRNDSLLAGLKMMFPECAVAGKAGSWSFRPDTVCIRPQAPSSGRLFCGSCIFLNITTTRAGALEALMHVEPGIDSWLFLEIGGGYGRSSSDGPRDIVGTSGVFRSVIDYEAFLIFLGMGVQHRMGAGRLELSCDIGRRSLSSSLANSTGTSRSLAQLSSDVAFTTLRYVHGFSTSPVMLNAGVRYYFADTPIDSEVQRFAISIGIGYRF